MISNVSATITQAWLQDIRRNYTWVGLFTAEPMFFNRFGEVTGPGYQRQKITWSAIGGGGVIQNMDDISWTGIDAGSMISHLGLFRDKTDQTVAAWGGLAVPALISVANDTTRNARQQTGVFTIAANQITFRVY